MSDTETKVNRADQVVDWVVAERFWLLMLCVLLGTILLAASPQGAWKPFDVAFVLGCLLIALLTMGEET